MVIDTSALLAILLGEPMREACYSAIDAEPDPVMSAGTLTEAFVASERKGVGEEMVDLVRAIAPAVAPVTDQDAWLALESYRRWGTGRHPARLNFGDCFSYVAAKTLDCPLLFIGDDFSQTDIRRVL